MSVGFGKKWVFGEKLGIQMGVVVWERGSSDWRVRDWSGLKLVDLVVFRYAPAC